MAVDIKKMVDAICSLTVLELSKLVKALRDKFGLRTSDTIRTDINEAEEADAGEDGSTEIAEADEVAEGSTEVEEESNKSEKESKPVPDPSSVPVPDPLSVPVLNPSSVKRPEGEDYDLVYAWKYCGDNRYAKIGISTKRLLPTRMPGTYHPTDAPELIGIYKCDNRQHAEAVESELLSKLKRTRSDREWVEIDEAFNEMIEKSFCKPPRAD